MRPVPERILTAYKTSLVEQRVPANLISEYKKWLRFYLDFCKKYQFPAEKQNTLPAFLEKLHSNVNPFILSSATLKR
jgi:hypothetical protein